MKTSLAAVNWLTIARTLRLYEVRQVILETLKCVIVFKTALQTNFIFYLLSIGEVHVNEL